MVCPSVPARARPLLVVALLLAPGLVTLAADSAASSPGDANGDGVVVVAVVDTGINPYHFEFRSPAFATDPGTFIAGYPADATPLHLTLDAPTYRAARDADAPTFRAIEKGRLYHVPGTKIVGAFVGGGAMGNTADDALPLIDDDGHGTAAASLAVGSAYGTCPSCWLVVVDGWKGLAWATEQRWIDVVSNSWGTIANAGAPVVGAGYEDAWTRKAAEHGQTVLFAAGNGVENAFVTPEQTYASSTNGPDWVVNVGATVRDPDGGHRAILGTGRPVDVVAAGRGVPAADVASLRGETGFSGTSASTPLAAGAFAETLRGARIALGDAAPGQKWTGTEWVVARGAPTGAGPLADGALTRAELWEAVHRAAAPTRSGTLGVYPTTLPRTDVGYANALLEGYGVVDHATAARALAHLRDTAPLPARDDVSPVFGLDAFVRDTLWGAWDRDGDGTRERADFPDPVLP